MKYKSRNLIVISAVILTWPSAQTQGYTWFTLGGQPVVWAGGVSERYLSPTTFPIGSNIEQQMLQMMGEWNAVPGSVFVYSAINASQDFPIDHFDGFNDTAAVPAADLDPGVLAVTYLVNQGAQWFDMDMVFSDDPMGLGYHLGWTAPCPIITDPVNNGFHFQLIAQHELGHAIGLGHDPVGDEGPGFAWFISTMNPLYPHGGTTGQDGITEIHADDRGGARFLYPHSGPSPPPHIDLALANFSTGSILGEAKSITFDPPAVLPGDTLTLTTVLENLGSTNEFFVRQGFYLSNDEIIDNTDTLIGFLEWDLAFGDAFDVDVVATMADDLPSGSFFVGSILDDLDTVAEVWEDNNAVRYCHQLTVTQLAPQIDVIGQIIVESGAPYVGPTPTVTKPLNMGPITWSLDNPEPGMTIDPMTGVITWPSPVPRDFQYVLFIRGTNGAGTATTILFLGVRMPCSADVTPLNQDGSIGNGVVNIDDLVEVLNAFGTAQPRFDIAPMNPDGTSGNGIINIDDLVTVLNGFGFCP